MLYNRCKKDIFGYCITSNNVPCPENMKMEFYPDCGDYLPNSVVNPATEEEKNEKTDKIKKKVTKKMVFS
jgi:hypothetical protein